MKKIFFTVISLFFLNDSPFAASEKLPLELIKLPPGFKIEIYTTDVPNARSMTLSPNGILFVGTRKLGNVYAVVDKNQDGKVDKVFTIAQGLASPNGVAFRDGSLYVAEINRVIRFDDIEKRLDHPPQPVVVNSDFPREGWHGWKFIRFGPDGLLYVSVGAPCNVCERDDLRFGSILRMEPTGKNLKVFARGIRNTVGFDWSPQTK